MGLLDALRENITLSFKGSETEKKDFSEIQDSMLFEADEANSQTGDVLEVKSSNMGESASEPENSPEAPETTVSEATETVPAPEAPLENSPVEEAPEKAPEAPETPVSEATETVPAPEAPVEETARTTAPETAKFPAPTEKSPETSAAEKSPAQAPSPETSETPAMPEIDLDEECYLYGEPTVQERIEQNDVVDAEMADVIASDMYDLQIESPDVNEIQGLTVVQAVDALMEAYKTELFSQTIYTTKISTRTDTATIDENCSAVNDFWVAYNSAGEKLSKTDSDNHKEKSVYDTSKTVAQRILKGEYVLTNSLERYTRMLNSIENPIENEDEAKTQGFSLKGVALKK